MSSLDSLITSDLAALRDDSRRNLIGLEDTLRSKNMYRDDRAGAEARRDALAGERRLELAMMPLALSHVFAHRVGRLAVGAAALLASIAMIAVLVDPYPLTYARWIVASLTSVGDLDLLACLTALGLVSVYVVAVWIAEAWFARRMRDTIRTSDQPYRDLDELARGPLEIAQQAVRRVDGWSMACSLGGGIALVLVFGYVAVIVHVFDSRYLEWSFNGLFHPTALERNVDVLVLAVFMTVGFAAWLGRAVHLERSAILHVLGHRTVLLILGALCFATAGYIASSATGGRPLLATLPPEELRYFLGIGATFVLVVGATWLLLWWRRREQARIAD